MKRIYMFILLYIVWLFLTWPFSPVRGQELIIGVIVVGFAVLLFGKNGNISGKYFEAKRYLWGLTYLPILFYYMIIANFDVLYRVLHPDVPINPGIVKVKTGLKNRIARAVLCNSITLTPGTLSVDIVEDKIYVHWINITDKKIADATSKIVGRFENILKKVFE